MRRGGGSEAESAGEVRNPFFARLYHYALSKEGREMVRCRRELMDGLAGSVVEVGPGNGAGFGLYQPSVARVVAVEPEPYLRARAREAAGGAPVPIEVVAGVADSLPLEDGGADAVVFALVLCSVPDQGRALAEARRVLRPGGQLRVFEHVVARHPLARGAQQAAQATFWPKAFGGCHPARDTLAAIEQAGFDVSGVRRFVMQVGPVGPPLPFILGTARVPG